MPTMAMKRLLSVRVALAVAACVICLGAAVRAQDSDNQGSLGDVARQTRAQHASASAGKSGKAPGLVDEMPQEQEAEENVPTGFKGYDAGDYRLFVPFPYSLEGRDHGGAVLLGPKRETANTEIVAGAPVPIPANLSDNDLLDAARQLASTRGEPANCFAIEHSSRKTYRCSWQNGPVLLGRQVCGSMEIIVGSKSLIPVMCVSPVDMSQPCAGNSDGHNACNDRDRNLNECDQPKAQAVAGATFRDERTTAQTCEEIIYPSIQLKEDIVAHPASISDNAENKPPRPAPTAGSVLAPESAPGEAESPGPSLAELARQTRRAPHDTAQAKLDNVEETSVAPAGFQSFVLAYCLNPQHCSEASVVIPEKAEVVSRVNGQHIFKAWLDGEPVMLYAGPADVNAPYRSLTDADYIRIRDLANAHGSSREKPDSASTQELTIEDRPALMTRFRYQRDQNRWWIGERVLIENQGAEFLVGCAAPEEHFADAEALCTTLVNSLRLP
jgi:hypothetical protein